MIFLTNKNLGMQLDFLKKAQRDFLSEGSYHIGQTVEERFQEIFDCINKYASKYGKDVCARINLLIDKNIISLSTPAIANLGVKSKGNTTPLPCSCNIVTPGDSIYSIYSSNLEVAMLSKLGAGVGVDFDFISESGTEIDENFHTNSKMDWIEPMIDTTQKVSQNGVRRGYGTPFLSIEDKDFDKLIASADKNNTDSTKVMVDNTIGIKIPEGFMDKLYAKDKVAQKKWLKLLNIRKESGQAYISFVENMNRNNQRVYKKLGLVTGSTNICTEFVQPYIDIYTPVCVISALNLLYWDQIKSDPQIIKDAIVLLNIMNDEYVRLTENVRGLEKSHASARDKRDIGLGTLGFHSLLQLNFMEFGGVESRRLNKEIYSTIRKYADESTQELAWKFGPCKVAKAAGENVYNCSLIMVAPNKTSSFISGAASLGIEPYFSNTFTKKLSKIQHEIKNPYLEKILQDKGKSNTKVWRSISDNLGSVSHLDFLSQEEKNVFKTFNEISPKDIIDLASDRQLYIDMSQSLNLMNRPNYTMKDLNQIHMYAYEKGIKTLYYFYPQAHASMEKNGERWDACASCAD